MNNPALKNTFKPLFRQPKYNGNSNGDPCPVTQSDKVNLGLMLGNAYHANPDNDIKLFNLCILDFDDPDIPLSTIGMQFFGHGIVPDPVNPELVSIFEKRGKGACEIDLKQGIVTRTIETSANREFYGHGAYSNDGSLLYCTETIVEGDYKGIIAVRDAKTHNYLGEFPSFGSSPHDCRLVDDGKTLVITNGGGKIDGIAPNVSYIDVATETLIDSLSFDTQTINAGHLDITSSGKLAVVSAQRSGLPEKALGGISIKQQDNKLHTITQPKKLIERLYDESLSVCINESNDVVGVTTPTGNLVSFWNLNTSQLLHYYILPNPRGIELTLDGKYFVVSYGQGDPAEAICLICAETLQHIKGSDLSHTGITGSHLTAYTFPPELRN